MSTRIAGGLVRPIVLSGGSGTRLWPLSTPERPKQFLPLVGKRSLLHETFARVDDGELFSPPTVICGAAHVDLVLETAHTADLVVRVIAEPCARNTAAAVALAALTAAHADELLLVLPSDHHIERPEQFRATVAAARIGAERGLIVTFGMKPTRAETGFGYVESGEPLCGEVRQVRRFIEKPDAARAAEMVASGRYMWNGGMFFATAATLLNAFEQHSPDVLAAVRASLGDAATDGHVTPDAVRFATVPAIAFDHAVMERFEGTGVIPSDFGWSDVGSWMATFERAALDADGNSVEPGSAVIDGSGNLLRSSGPRLIALGVEGLMVLATDDVVLVMPLAEAQRVREAHAHYQATATP